MTARFISPTPLSTPRPSWQTCEVRWPHLELAEGTTTVLAHQKHWKSEGHQEKEDLKRNQNISIPCTPCMQDTITYYTTFTIKIKQMWVNIPSMENLGGNVWDVTKSLLTPLAYFAKLHLQTIPAPKKKHPEKEKWNSETFCLLKDHQIASQFSPLPKKSKKLGPVRKVHFQISHAASSRRRSRWLMTSRCVTRERSGGSWRLAVGKGFPGGRVATHWKLKAYLCVRYLEEYSKIPLCSMMMMMMMMMMMNQFGWTMVMKYLGNYSITLFDQHLSPISNSPTPLWALGLVDPPSQRWEEVVTKPWWVTVRNLLLIMTR